MVSPRTSRRIASEGPGSSGALHMLFGFQVLISTDCPDDTAYIVSPPDQPSWVEAIGDPINEPPIRDLWAEEAARLQVNALRASQLYNRTITLNEMSKLVAEDIRKKEEMRQVDKQAKQVFDYYLTRILQETHEHTQGL